MGHNVLPHHHHEEAASKISHHQDEEAGHHSQDNDHHNDDGETSPFSDYSHSSELGRVVTKPVSFDQVLLKATTAFIVLQAYVLSLGVDVSPIIKPPIENSRFSSSVYCYCLPLRAPPALA